MDTDARQLLSRGNTLTCSCGQTVPVTCTGTLPEGWILYRIGGELVQVCPTCDQEIYIVKADAHE